VDEGRKEGQELNKMKKEGRKERMLREVGRTCKNGEGFPHADEKP
jgi:hypothetical protein